VNGIHFLTPDGRHMLFYWHLPVLILVISLVYSATRFEDWGQIVRESARWAVRMTSFLLAVAAVLYFVAVFI
jgi:hypothetical protein